jgi:hypothetical protein
MKEKDCGLTRHDSTHGPVGVNIDGRILVSNWCQNAPIWPVFPAHPTFKYIAVNNLQFRQFHGMEEVVGSIPTRSTNYINNLKAPPLFDFVAFLSQIPKSLREPAD